MLPDSPATLQLLHALALGASVLLLGGIAGLAVYAKIVEADPYRRQSYVKYSMAEHTFKGRTLHGYELHYSFRVFYEIVDRRAFREARMCEEEAKRSFAKRWHDEVFMPAFEKRHFFSFLKFMPEQPYLMDYNDAGDRIEIKSGNPYSMEYPEFEEAPLISGCRGCSATVSVHDPDPATIERNNKAMDESVRARILADHEELSTLEAGCVAAQRASVEAVRKMHTSHIYSDGDPVEIRTQLIDTDALRISWRKAGYRDWRLIGYREAEGFDSGVEKTQILDSREAEDSIINSVHEGRTYYYTLALRKRVETGFFKTQGEFRHLPAIRFSVPVPLSNASRAIKQVREQTEAGEALLGREEKERKLRRVRGEDRDPETVLGRFQDDLQLEARKERIRRSVTTTDLRERAQALRRELAELQQLHEAGELEEEDYEALAEDIQSLFQG